MELELSKTLPVIDNPTVLQNDTINTHKVVNNHWLVSSTINSSNTNNIDIHSASSGGVEYTGLTLLRLHIWMQQPFDRLDDDI